MSIKKNLIIWAISVLSLWSCDFPDASNTPEKNISNNNKTPTTTVAQVQKKSVSALRIIGDTPEDDAKELAQYSLIHKELLAASKTRNNLLDHSKTLQNNVTYMWYSQLIPQIMRESRMGFISEGKAKWYWQLLPAAIDEMNKLLDDAGIDHSHYNPSCDHHDNCLYMLLYFWHMLKKAEKRFPHVSKDDHLKFAFASYTVGDSKFWFMYDALGQPTSRDDFIQKASKLTWQWDMKITTDPYYNVPAYKDYFTDTTIRDNTTVYKKGTYHGNTISVTWRDIYLMGRYVEIINALQRFLKK
jgi:hypothetical protein